MVKAFNNYDEESFASYYGISRNPSTRNYTIVVNLVDDDLHNFLTIKFSDLVWKTIIDILLSIAWGLDNFHARNLVLCLCKLQSYRNIHDENDIIYGSIPCISLEVLRGNRENKFTREGNIYSFGGIMYEIVTSHQPFADQAHDTYLILDICNGVRLKVPDLVLNWIPEWYLNLMYRCWSGDPSECPTSFELSDLFYEIHQKRFDNIVDNNVMRQVKIADENQKKIHRNLKSKNYFLIQVSYILNHVMSAHILKLSKQKRKMTTKIPTEILIKILNNAQSTQDLYSLLLVNRILCRINNGSDYSNALKEKHKGTYGSNLMEQKEELLIDPDDNENESQDRI
ncbi:hypothetical protein Glove_264g8 [Diversispora epigaea]|uniref:Protein kinase domain-containing protein n=1 Tax=Diversispora epigaea TaxID=1348612 RepID=A0A397I5I8_9GLOM|nr:hypothetical protein Glove_264g8 [Diversispora epigaea]